MTKKIKVGLLFGGRSGEHEVSLASAMSVYNALDKNRYEVTLIAIDKDGRWLLPDVKALLAQAENPMLVKLSKTSGAYGLVPYPNSKQLVAVDAAPPQVGAVDVMLPILHGTFGEDGTIQGLLELAQIPYVGSGVLGSAIGMDKDVATRLLAAAGIPVVTTICLRKNDYVSDPKFVQSQLIQKFKFPFFIKPANAGSSVGVHKVKSADQLPAALEDAFSFDLKVLAQEGINARELEVSVLGNDKPKASVVGEVIPTHEFYSYESKYIDENGASFNIPAKNVPKETMEQARAWACEAFKVLELRGMARVDFFLDKDSGKLYLNEVNTIPGFTKISMYPKMWEATGLGYAPLLDELIKLALEHHEHRHQLKTSYDVKDWKSE
jgi:D-alanine-D-alanine ligase